VVSNQQVGSSYYNVYILSSNGAGAFSVGHTYSLPQPGYTIVTADFNGDGNLDLMVFGTDPTTQVWGYSMLLGNGDGSFQPAVFYPQSLMTGAEGYSVAVADFNNDHKLDVAVTSGNGSLALLLGNGDGTFSSPAYLFDAAATFLVTADFNGDGKLDIAAGGTNPTTETALLFGNGDGTFQPAVFPASLSGFVAEFTADLNNDGRPDLVSSYQVALGNGDGTFTLLPMLSGGNTFIDALADLNGDGKPDAFVTYFGVSSHPLQTGVLLGNGDGTFGPLINVPTSGLLLFPSTPLMIADMNGDGLPDLIFPWSGPYGLGVMLNTTQVGPPPPDFQVVASGLSPTPVIPGSSATSTISIAPLHGFSGTVALSCTGLPSGVGCSFTPASLAAGSGTSTLTVTTTSSLQAGSYTVIANGVSGTLSRIAALALTVESGLTPDFQISATATTPATVAPGSAATSTVSITPVSGFNSAVALTCSSVVSGVTCSLNPTSVTPSGTGTTSTLTINTSATTALGTYSVTVSGTSGSNAHSTSVTLTVQVPSDFTLGPASGSPTSQTISAGQTASFNLAFAPTGSFTGTLNLSCSITPAVTPPPTCNLSSSSVQISGSGGASVAVAVGTTAPVTTSIVPQVFPPPTLPLAWTLTLLASGWLFVRQRKRLPRLAAPVIVLALASLAGCGGGSSPAHTTPGTPPGTYAATITATSGNLSHSMPLTVVVQ
jgi:trimeric autotransporter adhesin